MVNHIQTLLLNESASRVISELNLKDYGYINSKFTSISLPSDIKLVYDSIIPETEPQLKLNRVKQLLVYTEAPEFSKFLSLFDTRATYKRTTVQNIPEFYNNIHSSTELDMNSCILAGSTTSIFNASDTSSFNLVLKELYELYLKSPETVKKFSALLFALIVQLHINYNKAQ